MFAFTDLFQETSRRMTLLLVSIRLWWFRPQGSECQWCRHTPMASIWASWRWRLMTTERPLHGQAHPSSSIAPSNKVYSENKAIRYTIIILSQILWFWMKQIDGQCLWIPIQIQWLALVPYSWMESDLIAGCRNAIWVLLMENFPIPLTIIIAFIHILGNLICDALVQQSLRAGSPPEGHWATSAISMWNGGGMRMSIEKGSEISTNSFAPI